MAIGIPVSRGTNTATASATSLALTLSSGIPAGDVGVILFASNNVANESNEHTGITDPRGNTWTQVEEVSGRTEAQATGGGITLSMWMAEVQVALQAGDVLTLNLSASQTAKAAGVASFSIDGDPVVDFSGTDAGIDDPGPSIATGTLPTTVERILLGAIGFEGPIGALGTHDLDYTGLFTADVGGSGNDNVIARLEYRIATLDSDTYNHGVGLGRDWTGILLVISEGAEVGGPVQSEPVNAVQGESVAIDATVRAFGDAAGVQGESASIASTVRAHASPAAMQGEGVAITAMVVYHATAAAVQGESVVISASSALPFPVPPIYTIAGSPNSTPTIAGAPGTRTITGWPS